jgi:Restriction endonuclease
MTSPLTDSWYHDALAIPRPASLADLSRLSPNEFELFSLLVISSIYGRNGLKFEHTPFTHDGGRDADAQYILGVGLDEALQMQFRIWLEVKQRRKTHVGKKDVGSHLVDASIEHAQTIIFVTNTSFSRNLTGWLSSFSKRTGIQHKLIDGADLIDYAARYLAEADATPASAISALEVEPPITPASAICWFSLSPFDVHSKMAPHRVITRQGRPLYLNVELTVPRNQQPFRARLLVRSEQLGAAACHPHTLSSTDERLFVSGDIVTAVYNIWPHPGRAWSAADFQVVLESAAKVTIAPTFLNEFELEYLSLPDIALPTQQEAFAALLRETSIWRNEPAARTALLVAPPGAGKSHLLGKLRRKLASERVDEIYIDCETVRDDRGFFRQVVQDLLPLPSAILDAELRESIRHWCDTVGIGADAAHDVVEDLCGADDRASRLAPRHRAELLSLLLGQRSSVLPQVVIVEDLHKAAPSLLSLLWQLASVVRDRGCGRIFFIFCTRPYATDTSELRTEWLAQLGKLATSEAATLLSLDQPPRSAAAQFLSAAVEGLQAYHIEQILTAVGSSPYALRESLLYLLLEEVLEVRSGASQLLSVVNPLRLTDICASPKLQQATQERLQILFRNHPEWLRRFLLAGAAYGRAFPSPVIARALGIPDDDALDQAVETCGRWSVATGLMDRRNWIEFDHDLIRDAVLRIATPRQRQRVSGALYEQLKHEAPEGMLARIAYQAGLAADALEHATKAAREAKRSYRLEDVVELNQLAIQTLDPDMARLSVPDPTAEYGFRLDSAIRFATPARVADMQPEEIDRRVLHLLIENLDCLASIGSGSSGLSASTLSEAYMIATRAGEPEAEAHLAALEGRLRFERDEVEKALELHQLAEERFARAGVKRSRARAENFTRLAICYRTLGEQERSFEHLRLAMRACVRGEWSILNKIRNNAGAIFLRSDWAVTRIQWEKELAHARRHHLDARVVHALLGLSFLDLFERDLEAGVHKTRQAIEIIHRLRLDNQSVRAALNMSVYHIMRGDYDQAFMWLQDGEKTALRHRIGRRLWRVVSNMATVHELRGETRLCAIRDRQAANLLLRSSEADAPTPYGRQILALVNLLLRRNSGIGAEDPAPSLPSETFVYAAIVERQRVGQLPDLMENYCVDLPVGRRFLLTE